MASCLVSVGRLLSFVLVGLQASSLASYPAQYKHKDSFYELVVLFIPTVGLWLYIMCDDKKLQWLLYLLSGRAISLGS